MDRRTFVKSSAGSLVVGAVDPIELGNIIAPNWTNVSASEMNEFLTGFDNTMHKIEVNHPQSAYLGRILAKPLIKQDEDLLRGSLRSLLLAGNFGDMSLEAQVHPGVQSRLKYSAAEVDSTMEGVLDKLRSFSSEDCLQLKQDLSDHPELTEQVLEALDMEAAAVGTHKRRRRKLQRIGKRVLKRLKHSPQNLIEDCLAKCDKLVKRFDSDDEMQKFMAANMGKKVFRTKVEKAEKAAMRWQEMQMDNEVPGYQPNVILREHGKVLDPQTEVKKENKGLKLLGIGLILTAAGWLFIAIGGEGVLMTIGVVAGVTVGPILILIALIMLLLRALKKS